MKIAYFSPLNPQKSGISDYSEYLIEALAKYVEIDVWVDGFQPTNHFIRTNLKIFDYTGNPEILSRLDLYDEIIYNIGNNPYYHTSIYDVFLKYNGIVILHEYVLYYLITGYILDFHHDNEKYLEEIKMNHGDKGYAEGLKILRSSIPPLQYKEPENLPLNKRLIEQAKGIIVHSLHAKHEVQKINPNVSCINISQIGPDPVKIRLNEMRFRELKDKFGIPDDKIIIASFGYISQTKRIHKVLRALADIKSDSYIYLLVGEGDYIQDSIRKYKLNDKVVITGFTTIDEFDDLIALSDIVINLRYPYMGETSASLIRALLLSKPSIVSDIGWFSELPTEVVVKIPLDNNEIDYLKSELFNLVNDSSYRMKYSLAAKEYSEQFLSSDVIANNIYCYLQELNKGNAKKRVLGSICDKIGRTLDEIGITENDDYYISSLARAIQSIFISV